MTPPASVENAIVTSPAVGADDTTGTDVSLGTTGVGVSLGTTGVGVSTGDGTGVGVSTGDGPATTAACTSGAAFCFTTTALDGGAATAELDVAVTGPMMLAGAVPAVIVPAAAVPIPAAAINPTADHAATALCAANQPVISMSLTILL